MRTRQSVLVVFALLLSGCEWVAAMVLSAGLNQPCDPKTYVASCPGEHSTLNCTELQRAGGFKVGAGWSEFRDSCQDRNVCRIVDGFAECIAIPETPCDLEVDKNRCVNGQTQYCAPMNMYRGDALWDGKLARWVLLDEACAPSN